MLFHCPSVRRGNETRPRGGTDASRTGKRGQPRGGGGALGDERANAEEVREAGQAAERAEGSQELANRTDPFAADWRRIVEELERDAGLQAKTLFAILAECAPGRYQGGQLRTLQRHIAAWRDEHGPEREVMFEQQWRRAEYGQSDFTNIGALAITIAGEAFRAPALSPGAALLQLGGGQGLFLGEFRVARRGHGGLPAGNGRGAAHSPHRQFDCRGASDLKSDGAREFTERYLALLAHYGMRASTNHPGVSHQNGDVESAHGQFKRALDQALRVRGHRDFADRAALRSVP